MKKFLPIVLLGIGLLVVIAAGIISSAKNKPLDSEDSDQVAEIPVDKRPTVSLVPVLDLKPKSGLWLRLTIDDIKVDGAFSLDYELLYYTSDGKQGGVKSAVELGDIYMGSESNGKFTQDKGVKNGTLTLKFRDNGGKVIGKLLTDFTLDQTTKGYNLTLNPFSSN